MISDSPASNTPRNWAVIVAAGSGSRFGAELPKQYHLLRDKTVLEHSLAAFEQANFFDGIVLVVAAGDSHVRQLSLGSTITVVVGGKQRSDSVSNGLAALGALSTGDDWVWVHDGARPCIANGFLMALSQELGQHEVGGVPVLPVTDTIKSASQKLISHTISRTNLWRAQTPQIFRYKHINKGLHKGLTCSEEITDESSAVELLGLQPKLLRGRGANIKITRQQDLSLANYYLSQEAET